MIVAGEGEGAGEGARGRVGEQVVDKYGVHDTAIFAPETLNGSLILK